MAEQDALIDGDALQAWLTAHVKGDPPLVLERMGEGTGVANALFAVRWGDRDLVLRRGPAAKITASAGDTMREGRLLAALADTDARHPRLVAFCDDSTVIGVPFILMERIDGFTPIDPLPAPFDHDPSARHGLGTELVDALAELALVDWRAVGLDGFGKPDGFLARQVDRWLWQLDSYRSRDIPELDTVTGWLRREPAGARPDRHHARRLQHVQRDVRPRIARPPRGDPRLGHGDHRRAPDGPRPPAGALGRTRRGTDHARLGGQPEPRGPALSSRAGGALRRAHRVRPHPPPLLRGASPCSSWGASWRGTTPTR